MGEIRRKEEAGSRYKVSGRTNESERVPKKVAWELGMEKRKRKEGGKPTRATDATFVMLPFQRGARCGIACLRALDKSAYSATGWSSRDTI